MLTVNSRAIVRRGLKIDRLPIATDADVITVNTVNLKLVNL
jgi:hypothetical protein